MNVKIVLHEGPVRIPSLAGTGLDASHQLWNDIIAYEQFPAEAQSANYVVTLAKPVTEVDQVESVESELVSALRLLATAWPFAGGSFMALETREIVRSARFQNNAEAVRDQLLADKGLSYVSSRATVHCESVATYRSPPLRDASIIARAAQASSELRRMLEYHQSAWMGYYRVPRADRDAWFINLYKVREVLTRMHHPPSRRGSIRVRHPRKPPAVVQQLQIKDSDWNFFGRVLNNNDLRHAELTGAVPNLPKTEIDRLFRLARDWSSDQLRFLGLPAS